MAVAPLYRLMKSRAKSDDPDVIHVNRASQLSAQVRAGVTRLADD
jgi:hypothetical protein